MAQTLVSLFVNIISEPSQMRRVEVAIEAAQIAGAVIQSSNGAELDIQEKTIVTAADLRSQQEVMRVIRRACPDDLIVGEEGSDGKSTSPSRWYVDPLDGTTNYAHRLPFYCVSIAYCDVDGVAIGVVNDQVRGDMFTAVRNGGATLNGRPIAVSANHQLRSSLLATQVQSDDPEILDRYTRRLRTFLGVARAVRSPVRRLWRLPTWLAGDWTRFSKTI